MKKELPLSHMISLMEARDIRGLTRAISIVENDRPGKEELLEYAYFKRKTGDCLIVGFTGAPGVGKSTLINHVIKQYRQSGKTVGVIAVDPTSPYSGGAVLGDRIRMAEHNTDSGVYIRSLANRKAIGGLSEATKYILYLYVAFGFDTIILETLGVGQDEIDVAKYVDVVSLILVPGYGDTIQMAKSGIMEVADLFIINKSDKSGADTTKEQLSNALCARNEGNQLLIVNTVAERGEGIGDVIQAIQEIVGAVDSGKKETRTRQRIAAEIRSAILYRINGSIDRRIDHYVDRIVKEGSMTPMKASDEILKLLGGDLGAVR